MWSSSYALRAGIPLPLGPANLLKSVIQQLLNTGKSQVFHSSPQDSVTAQNSTHVLYSEKSVSGEQGLSSFSRL